MKLTLENIKSKLLFGPIPSRRLGLSLGIDLVKPKTCSMNCLYCESGRTTQLTGKRMEYVPVSRVIKELEEYLKSGPALDYITFSGAGEPTLHSGIGRIVAHIKNHHPGYKTALLTNGSLFHLATIRKRVLPFDLIIPSLDAALEKTFVAVNRPLKGITAKQVIEGLIKLRREFRGRFWLEIFIVPGMNDNKNDLLALKTAVKKIRPDQVQLNSMDRPGTEGWVKPVPAARLRSISRFLHAKEIIPRKSRSKAQTIPGNIADAIVRTVSRRPCTLNDLAVALGIAQNDLRKHVKDLRRKGKLFAGKEKRGLFYYSSKR